MRLWVRVRTHWPRLRGSDRNPHVYQLAWCSRSRPAGREYAVGCGGPRSSPVCVSLGGASDAIAEEATCASLLGSPHFGNDTHGGSTTRMGIGEEAGESNGKTSFLPVLRRMLRAFRSTGDRLRGVHQKHRETGCEGFTQKKVKQNISQCPMALSR